MRSLLAGLFCLSFIATPVQAESADLGKMKCGELVEMAKTDTESFTYMVFWIDGYLSGVSGDTNFHDDGIGEFSENLLKGCQRSAKSRVLKMAEKVGLQ